MRDGHGSYITIMGILTCIYIYIYIHVCLYTGSIYWYYMGCIIYIYSIIHIYIYVCISHLGNVGDNEGFLK